ncbi:hypothetical protein HNP77_001042 [Treponema rectale]|uniref:Zinc-finger domain-containing protein n=1 Tax=Treponema rectale TaxID=744512 RepID=A0A840SGL4_9SPIR|nr:zf-HC2 domain-containing protein [Treponema rectale]MBB5218673.1 hypothetical protein [Treponema rectale]
MSTCPEKSIHSVYLDGELPQNYVTRYEAHVASCQECQKIQNALKKLRDFMQKDADLPAFSREDLDSSFNRLQVKLSYHKITGQSRPASGRFTALKYAATGIAAAAAVALVLPFAITKKTNTVTSVEEKFQPITRNVLKSPANNTVYTDGTFNTAELSSVFGGKSTVDYSVQATETVPYVKLATSAEKNKDNFSRMHLSSYDMFIQSPDMINEIPSYEQYSGNSFNFYTPTTVSYNNFNSDHTK